MTRRLALALVLVAAAASPALGHGETIRIFHDRFDPAELTVPPGTTVHFENVVTMPGGHRVVADDGSFESPPLNVGEGWHHVFEEVGPHPFHLKEHPKTKGRVVVAEPE